MTLQRLFSFLGCLVFCLLAVGCASSELSKYRSGTPQDIASEVKISLDPEVPGRRRFAGPDIDVRAGFGEFATGMFRGASELSSSVALQGSGEPGLPFHHQIVAMVQYTNLGGVYRNYDRAGIEGFADPQVTPLERHKQYTANGVIMTERVGVTIGNADLQRAVTTGLQLRLANGSGNLATFQIPTNYIEGYLLGVEQSIESPGRP